MGTNRKDRILATMLAELARQQADSRSKPPLPNGVGSPRYVIEARIDLEVMATAIDQALGETPPAGFSEGKSPDQLDATNDD